jgi:hypothetical protein
VPKRVRELIRPLWRGAPELKCRYASGFGLFGWTGNGSSSFATLAASEVLIWSASTACTGSGMPFSSTFLAASIARALTPTISAAVLAALPLPEPLLARCMLAASCDSSFASLARPSPAPLFHLADQPSGRTGKRPIPTRTFIFAEISSTP